MSIENLVNDRMDELQACKTPQELMSLLRDENVELTDEQLEAVVGGSEEPWSFEKFAELFAKNLAGIFPKGFDPKTIWGNIPAGGTH